MASGVGGSTQSSNELNATPENAPGAFSLTTALAANAQVAVSWGTSSNATSYAVYDATTAGAENTAGTPACSVSAPTLTCTASGLTNGTKYYFVAVASGVGGSTQSSNELNATPENAPGAFSLTTALAANAQVAVSWGTSSNATSYAVYDATTAGAENTAGTPACSVSAPTLTCTASGLTNGTKYYFVAVASGVGGSTQSSNELNATPVGTASPPTISKVQPTSGPDSGGTSVTITGSGFSTTAGATAVKFGSTAATGVTCISTTSCTAFSPPGIGTVDVTATVSAHTSSTSPSDQFIYLIADCARVRITQTTFVTWGHILCLGPGSVVYAPIFVLAGGGLLADGTNFYGSVSAVDDIAYQICGSQIAEEMSVSWADGLVTIGGPSSGTCAGNTITDELDLTSNTGGVEFDHNTVADTVLIAGTTGALPPPYSGSVQAVGNTIARGGKLIIKP